MRRLLLLAAALMVSVAAHGFDRPTGQPFASRSEVIGANGMAATSQPLATQAAIEILRKGGSAIDAAIAANAVLGLMEPTGCGIGGDLFAIVWDAGNEELTGLNASGRSPKSLSLDYFREREMDEIPYLGPLSVSVPGAVDGWFELHGRYGRLPMSEVLAPAIRYAEEGFPVSEVIAWLWANNAKTRAEYPGFTETFLPNSKAPEKGEVFKNPALAKTYRLVADEGRDAFYKGEIARKIGDFMAANGGFLSYDDMASHSSEWVEPVSTTYRGHEVFELPPNTQGIAALQLLNILEGFDIAAMGFGSPEYVHAFVEAKKVVYEDRARYYADPAFVETPVEKLVSKAYVGERRQLIDLDRAADAYAPGGEALENGDTIYMTVADSDGNMISLIQSNYGGMGSGVAHPELGFGLQNRGALFSLEEGHPNVFEPGKRPFHTIIPAFAMKEGQPWLSFGLMGGSMQPQGHAQILINMIDFGMNLQEAGDAARIRHAGSSQPTGGEMTDGGTVYMESGIGSETREALSAMGHDIGERRSDYGGYQAIMRDTETGVYYGASESRKDGQAAGY